MEANVLSNEVSAGFNIWNFIKKHFALCILSIFIIPAVVISIREAVVENNFILPFLQLGERLLASATVIYRNVMLFQSDPDKLIGMIRPESGLLEFIKYYLLFSWNVIFNTLANISFIFLPFTVIYKLVSLGDTSQKAKAFFIALALFMGYLFVSNSLVLSNEIAMGNIKPEVSEDRFVNYLSLFQYIFPFHGVYALGEYLIRTIFIPK